MRISVWSVVLALVASLVGAILSGALLLKHYEVEGENSIGFFAGACGEKGAGCDAVIHSRYGVFPFGPEKTEEARAPETTIGPPLPGAESSGEDEPNAESSEGGIPVAALGLAYYSVVFLWLLVVGVPSWNRRSLHYGLLGLCGLGAIGSCVFISIMAFVIGQWCVLCTSSHVANFALLAGVFLARPRATAEVAASGSETGAGTTHPAPRLLVAAGLVILAALVAEWAMAEISRTKIEVTAIHESLEEVRTELDAFKADREKLEVVYFQEKKYDDEELGITDDRPIIDEKKRPNGKPYPRMTLLIFSDLECPHCAKFDTLVFDTIQPMFNGHLRIVFKHLPLPSLHPNAFEAAMAAEAAHAQDKFWEAKHYLIERREKLRGLDYRKMGEDLGLDVEQFLRDKRSPRIKARVHADIRDANRLKLHSTPTAFLNGRKVSKLFRSNKGFWEIRSESLQRVYEAGKLPW